MGHRLPREVRKYIQVSTHLTLDENIMLGELCEDLDLTQAEILRRALREYYEKYGEKYE